MKWLARKEIVQKTVGMGTLHALSKVFGFVREMALARLLGVGALADAFFTSWRVPSLLRRFLAEGALNAAAVPRLLDVGKQDGKQAVSQLVTALLLCIQVVLLLLLGLIWYSPHTLLSVLVPGWHVDEMRYMYAYTAVRWAMLVVIPFSASALFAGALQVVHHFFVAAASQVVFNILLIIHIGIGIYYQYHMWWLLAGVVLYSFCIVAIHYWVYRQHGFSICWPSRMIWYQAAQVMWALVPCLVNYGAFELNMLVDHILVSFLPVGSQALLYYTSAFLQMPLSIFVSAFSTILLPHFSAVRGRTRRQQFYLLEAIKAAIWVLLPTTIIMIIFSRLIFATTVLASSHIQAYYVSHAAWLLIIGAVGLIAFAVNRICMNVFYSLHMPSYAGWITLAGTGVNIVLSALSMRWIGLIGVIAATVFAAWCKSVAYLYVLHWYGGITFALRRCLDFVWRFVTQLSVTGWGVYGLYIIVKNVLLFAPASISYFLLHTFGIWLWVGPLCLLWFILLYMTQHAFMVRVYFLRDLTSFRLRG